MITEGSYKIISGPCQFMFYLCHTRSLVKDKLYPKDCEKAINRHLAWYQNKMRPKTQRLIKMLMRQVQEEGGLITNETPRGQARQSMVINPSTIEFEVDSISKALDELDGQLRQQNSKFFGT